MRNIQRKPNWLKIRIPKGTNYTRLKHLFHDQKLHTVCEEALCPNVSECWGKGTATIMILGDICTRSCGFCAVQTGRPRECDFEEPERVAKAVKEMGLKHVVITSVDRDDLPDGGASIWRDTVELIHKFAPGCTVEVLIPDFKGNPENLKTVFSARPEIMGHNLETVPHLYRKVRPQAKFDRSLAVLSSASNEGLLTKTGIMVGLGETDEQILETMRETIKTGVSIFTIGQYLQPTKRHLPVERFVTPREFQFYREEGLKMGFKIVESGALVRSSYHAEEQIRLLEKATSP